MRLLVLISAVAILISCSNTENKTLKTPDTEIKNADSAQNSKKVLINEIKNFIDVITSKDKNKIKQVFTFPVADSMLSVYLDSSMQKLGHNNNGLVTEDIFLKKFDRIYEFWMLEECKNVLKNMPLDSLITENQIEGHDEPSDKNDPYYKFCSITVKNDNIYIGYGTNVKAEFGDKLELSERSDASMQWEFKFDGKKLIFVCQTAIG